MADRPSLDRSSGQQLEPSQDLEAAGEFEQHSRQFLAEIEQRRQAEAFLHKYRAAFERALDGMVVTDLDGIMQLANPALAIMHGYAGTAELIGRDAHMLHSGNQFQTQVEPLVGQMLERGSAAGEVWHTRKDGSVFPTWSSLAALKDEHGQMAGAVAIISDASERKKAQLAVERAAAYIESVVDSMADGLLVIAPDGTVRSANPALSRLTGYTREELVGMPIGHLFNREQAQAERWRADLFERCAAQDTAAEIHTKQGERIPVSMVASLLYAVESRVGTDLEGAPSARTVEGVVAVIRDVRESHMLAALEVMNAQLLEKSENLERADSELRETTSQLVQAEKLSALGELTAGIAHEMNQPLNGIRIVSQSLIRDIQRGALDTSTLAADLREIVTQVDKMSSTIDHMRLFSRRRDARRMDLLDINLVATSSLRLFRQQLVNHGVQLSEDYAPGLPPVWGEPIGLEQVILNLTTNAVHAVERNRTRQKVITLRTSFRAEEKSVVVEVEDNGLGISEEIRGKIFQPFFTTREPGSGTGLGLSVAQKIVQQHGGRLECTSEVGRGSVFTLSLPAVERPSDGPPTSSIR